MVETAKERQSNRLLLDALCARLPGLFFCQHADVFELVFWKRLCEMHGNGVRPHVGHLETAPLVPDHAAFDFTRLVRITRQI